MPTPGPAVEQGGAPGTPPAMGAGGASMPTPDAGAEAAALGQLAWVLRGMEEILPLVGANSAIGEALVPMIQKLGKMIPPGGGSPGIERNALDQMQQQQQQEQPMLQRLRAMGAGGQAGGTA